MGEFPQIKETLLFLKLRMINDDDEDKLGESNHLMLDRSRSSFLHLVKIFCCGGV